MAFRLELDPPAAGVTGTAVYTAEKDVTPKHVRLELAWATRGRGDADGGTIARGDVEIGPVAAGETVRVPFRFDPPGGMVRPFAGELVELFYLVRGRVDLPWAFDETAEVEVDLG